MASITIGNWLRTVRAVLVAALCLALLPMGASATTWYVDGFRGSNGYSGLSPVWPKRTIQSAIDASSRGDYVYRGIFADGSGTFDLIVEEDGAAFFAVTTEDGFWTKECEATVVGEALLLTFEDAEPLVIRWENGMAVGEPFAAARP